MSVRRFLVSGRVQGVGYRYFVQVEVGALGLSGWTRNLRDGRVEVMAQGDPPALAALEGRLWQGPPGSRVTAVEAEQGSPPQDPGFRILPTPE